MSDVQSTDPTPDAGVALPDDPASAMALIFDTIAPDAFTPEGEEGGAEAPAPAPGDESPAPAVEGDPGAAGPDGEPPAGDATGGAVVGEPAAPAEEATGFDASTLDSKWGELTTAIENRSREELENETVLEVKEEYPKYFEALREHPLEMVGRTVPSLSGEGEMTLRDSAQAKEWQEGVKQILFREVGDRVNRKLDDTQGMRGILNEAVGIFQNNPDLIPGSKQFDRELADQFAALAKSVEVRVDGKLTGYSIPVQGMISQVRQMLAKQRAAAPAAPATPSAQQQRAAEQPRNQAGQFAGDAPQAGIPARAGASGSEGEDMSAFWGAYGISDMRI